MTANGRGRAPVLITGGAGFIGANLANHLLRTGEHVLIYDNFSRAGVERNWQWLHAEHGSAVQLEIADTRDARALGRAVRQARAIFHFAAQVAVTTSLEDPALDFEVNAIGTLNLLHAWRDLASPPPLIYTSTNKVYGSLADVALRVAGPVTSRRRMRCARAASTKRSRLNSTAPTAARRAAPINTSSTMRAPSACRRSSFA